MQCFNAAAHVNMHHSALPWRQQVNELSANCSDEAWCSCLLSCVLVVQQVCQSCYSAEATRVASGAKSRLPGSLTLSDLTQQVRVMES